MAARQDEAISVVAGAGAGAGAGAEAAAAADTLLRVAVVYHAWPHYRQPVMQAMDGSTTIAYDFYGSGEPLEGVHHAEPGCVTRFVRAPFRRTGNLVWQSGAVRAACDRRYQAIVLLADPNFLSTWVAAIVARARGIPVLFWGHGWLRSEGRAKQAVRRAYFTLAPRFLVYAERGKRLGVAAGFPAERITVVYNSLDVPRADVIIAAIESGEGDAMRPQELFAEPARPLLICTARLTPKCRFDLLIEAAALLQSRGFPMNVLLVGDGVERTALEQQAAKLGVAVHFFGACHEEEVVGPLIYHADLTVSPGKIGLTAMHSLMYGTPAVTHGDFDAQMPEVEAIEEGRTGAFFRRDNAGDLADAIAEWFAAGLAREQVRAAARAAIRGKWTPQAQARIIEQAVLQVTGRA